ncbi:MULTISPECIES: Chromate resistance protein ChrB [unclassified Variovorax]|uniref:Chromate resistance protein ChrB n=1 Tax=unclassified Variovorax TaxID=663243 RepID=UPI003F483158
MNQEKRPSWLLLTYKVPAEPSKFRVAIWRRIRSLGAVYLQNSICVLPTTTEHQRQFRMVQADIDRAGGEAVIFETLALDAKQEERVVAYFKHDRDQDYEEFLDKCVDYKKEIEKEVKADHYTFAEVKENDEDLKKLKNWLERIKTLDFYGAPARATAEQRLVECEELLEAYANEVFEREQNAKGEPLEKPAAAKRLIAKSPAKSSAAKKPAAKKASKRGGQA